MRVDPNNRLVADTLEGQWNEKLRLLAQAKEECQSQQRLDALQLSQEQKCKILALAERLSPGVAGPEDHGPGTQTDGAAALEDVTLRRDQDITVQVRFKGGATHQLQVPLPKSVTVTRKTNLAFIAELDRLLDEHSETEIARLLNERGWRAGRGGEFSPPLVNRLRRSYQLKSRWDRLRAAGWLTVREIAVLLDCPWQRIKHWRAAGLLTGIRFDAARDYLYQKPSDMMIAKIRSRQRRHCWKSHHALNGAHEV